MGIDTLCLPLPKHRGAQMNITNKTKTISAVVNNASHHLGNENVVVNKEVEAELAALAAEVAMAAASLATALAESAAAAAACACRMAALISAGVEAVRTA